MQSINLTRRLLVAPAVLALAVGVSACSSGDDDDQARTESKPLGNGEESSGSSADGTAATESESSGDVPQDSDLDVEMRNPDGTMLTLSHIAFEGDNVLVNLEFFNGSPRLIYVHSTAGGEPALRLVDDAGNTYNFQAPPEQASGVFTTIEQGETLSGTFAFLGPLNGRPESLRLVTNVADDQIDTWSLDDEVGRGACCLDPGFVVPIDLTWD